MLWARLGNDQLANMPLILRRQLEFPYAEGFSFTTDVWGLGGYDAVNQAIQTPPASTEQILHSDKYYNHEAPVVVTPHGPDRNLGAGFANVYQQTMGELNIQVLATGGEKPALDVPGLPAHWPHQEVAAGWGGDRLNMYEDAASGAWLIDWQTAWDTQADADEFTARMTELQSTFAGPIAADQRTADGAGRDRVGPEHSVPGTAARADGSGYIESGAEIPRSPSAAASVTRVASTSARR